MKRHLRSAALALAFACAVTAPTWAQTAQIPPELQQNTKIVVDYIDPRNAKYEEHLERLRSRRVLEQLAQFLAPLRLPRTLRLRTKQCGAENAYYDGTEWAITFCYEMLDFIDRLAPKQPVRGVTRQDVFTGSIVGIMFHELGHALFDILNVPVFGREEDAADQIAAFIMVQFGKEVALTTIKGTSFLWATQPDPTIRAAFSDEHGTPSQRFYNNLCIAYGADPATFKEFVDAGMLPTARAENCAREYKQAEFAFAKTVLPYVDQDLMKKVQATKWLP
jgi:hypothetical protein